MKLGDKVKLEHKAILNMKNILILLAAFVVLGGGTWWYTTHKNDKTTLVDDDKNFAIENTANIGRIFLADRKNQTLSLVRGERYWTLNDKHIAKPNSVKNILEVIEKVRVRYIPSKNASANIIKDLASDGVKVEIYDLKGKLMKTWYVGGMTNDELGTHMIMEGSEQPYVCEIPTMEGGLRARFYMAEQDWRDKSVFFEPQTNIQSVSVEYPEQKAKSFKINLENGQYLVSPFYDNIPKITKVQKPNYPESYLKGFESIVAEAIDNQNVKRDSLGAFGKPFTIISMTNKQGTERKVKLYSIIKKNQSGEIMTDNGQTLKIERFYADCNCGDFFLVQDIVFNKLFWEYKTFF